jgi:hypothetical protein
MKIIENKQEALYKKGDITDIFEYKIYSKGDCFQKQVLYDIKHENTIMKNDLQLREIHCDNFDDAKNILDHINEYQIF